MSRTHPCLLTVVAYTSRVTAPSPVHTPDGLAPGSVVLAPGLCAVDIGSAPGPSCRCVFRCDYGQRSLDQGMHIAAVSSPTTYARIHHGLRDALAGVAGCSGLAAAGSALSSFKSRSTVHNQTQLAYMKHFTHPLSLLALDHHITHVLTSETLTTSPELRPLEALQVRPSRP